MLSITNLIQSIISLFKGLPVKDESARLTLAEYNYLNGSEVRYNTPQSNRKPQMDTMYILSLLIPALSEIAHDAITAYYKLHGHQFTQPWASAPQEQKNATTVAVVNAMNGNPDTATAAGNLVNAIVTTAKTAIDLTITAHQAQQPAPVVSGAQIGPSVTLQAEPAPIPVGEATEVHVPMAVNAPATQTPQASAEWHPGAEPSVPEPQPATNPEAPK